MISEEKQDKDRYFKELDLRRERVYSGLNSLQVYISALSSGGLIFTANAISGEITFWLLLLAGSLFFAAILTSLASKGYNVIWYDDYFRDFGKFRFSSEGISNAMTSEKNAWLNFVSWQYIFTAISVSLLFIGFFLAFLGMMNLSSCNTNILFVVLSFGFSAFLNFLCFYKIYKVHMDKLNKLPGG
jgi:hypothetical protein